MDATLLATVTPCEACHPEQVSTWSQSAHAHASFSNPWYRASIEDFRDAQGFETSRFCAGCHDPLLLFTGAIDAPVTPETPHATAGVTCLVCHGAQDPTADGNASLTVQTAPVPIPDGETNLSAHRARLRAPGDALCATCHRGFVGEETGNVWHHLGQDEPGAWSSSAYAGSLASLLDEPVSPAGCIDCHMGAWGHRVPGAQSALPDPDPVQEMLTDAVEVHLVLRTTAPLVVDAILFNRGVGHRFPGGVTDTHDTWLEIRLLDGETVVAENREHVLRSRPLDVAGQPVDVHRVHQVHTVGWDHTLGPRQARAVRYVFDAPLPEGLIVEARLRHRRHDPALRDAACATSKRAPGFGIIDGCAPEPVWEIARTQIEARETSVEVRTRWLQGLALSGDVQENLADALIAFDEGLAEVADDRWRARLLAGRAAVLARQGRRDEALQEIARVEAIVGAHPSLWRLRGRAHARVWDWDAAATAYAAVTTRAPRDTAAWRDLALAEASRGDRRAALEAAQSGLRRQPRDPDLLRVQALSLNAMAHPDADVAEDAWLAHRKADDASSVQLRCEQSVAGCWTDRQPIPVRTLHPTTP